MTMEPAVKTREARRMVGLRPKRSQKGPATSENSHAAPTLMGIEDRREVAEACSRGRSYKMCR